MRCLFSPQRTQKVRIALFLSSDNHVHGLVAEVPQRRVAKPIQKPKMGQKRVWTLSKLLASIWAVLGLVWTGFRMFSRIPGVCMAGNAVRVPPRARHIPSSEGFLLYVLTWLVVASL